MVASVVGFILFAFYYVGVRVIEQQWPAFGVLLGLPSSPDTYSKSNAVTPATAAVPAAPTTAPTVNIFSPTPSADSTADSAPAAPVSFADTQAKIDATPEVTAPEVTAPDVSPAPAPATPAQ
jgi:hypothetical protein